MTLSIWAEGEGRICCVLLCLLCARQHSANGVMQCQFGGKTIISIEITTELTENLDYKENLGKFWIQDQIFFLYQQLSTKNTIEIRCYL